MCMHAPPCTHTIPPTCLHIPMTCVRSVYIRTHTHMHTHILTQQCVHAHVHTHVHTYTHKHAHTAYMYAHHMHACTHTHTHTHTHTRTHTQGNPPLDLPTKESREKAWCEGKLLYHVFCDDMDKLLRNDATIFYVSPLWRVFILWVGGAWPLHPSSCGWVGHGLFTLHPVGGWVGHGLFTLHPVGGWVGHGLFTLHPVGAFCCLGEENRGLGGGKRGMGGEKRGKHGGEKMSDIFELDACCSRRHAKWVATCR